MARAHRIFYCLLSSNLNTEYEAKKGKEVFSFLSFSQNGLSTVTHKHYKRRKDVQKDTKARLPPEAHYYRLSRHVCYISSLCLNLCNVYASRVPIFHEEQREAVVANIVIANVAIALAESPALPFKLYE